VSGRRTILLYDEPMFCFRGDNVEEAFLETAKKIYQSIQDGRLDLNAAESGVQHKPSQPGRNNLTNDQQANKDNCAC
jgi:Ras-related protein Rab-14